MDHTSKIHLFKLFTFVDAQHLEERFFTIIQSTLPQWTENNQVCAQIVDTLTTCYLKQDDFTVPATLMDTYFNILQIASGTSTNATTATVLPIENDTEYLKKWIYNSIRD